MTRDVFNNHVQQLLPRIMGQARTTDLPEQAIRDAVAAQMAKPRARSAMGWCLTGTQPMFGDVEEIDQFFRRLHLAIQEGQVRLRRNDQFTLFGVYYQLNGQWQCLYLEQEQPNRRVGDAK